MQPADQQFPGPDDADLVRALERRIPIPADVLASLHAHRDMIIKEGRKAPAEEKIIRLTPAQTGSRRSVWRPLMAVAALLAIALVATWQLIPRTPATIAGVGPAGEVATTQPEIAWENAPDKSYNVWILPPDGDYTTAPALFVAKSVRSPVKFSELKPGKDVPPGTTALEPDKDYRVLVCYDDAGKDPVGMRIAGTPVKFRVSAAAKKP